MSNNQLATTPPKVSPLAIMAARFNADPAKLLETLKATVFATARNNEELQALVIVANAYNLNPLTKEIYAFPAKGGGIVPVISIDGWANLANSHPQMDGVDFEWSHDGRKLVSCTCIVHRKDRGHPIKVTEYLDECRRNTDPWKMEHRMLRHKAFCQAVRIAFGFSGVYEEDEAERMVAIDVTPPAAETSKLFKTPALTQGSKVEDQQEGSGDDSFSLDPTPPPTIDRVRSLLVESNLKWRQVNETLIKSAITAEDYATPEDAPEELLFNSVRMWPQIVELVKKGGASK